MRHNTTDAEVAGIAQALARPTLDFRRTTMWTELGKLPQLAAASAGDPPGLHEAVQRYVRLVHPNVSGEVKEEAMRIGEREARAALAERVAAERQKAIDLAWRELYIRAVLGGVVRDAELRALAETEIAELDPPLTGEAQRTAVRDNDARLRDAAETAYAKMIRNLKSDRVVRLADLASSGLADMPKEIRRVAMLNLAGTRPMFGRRTTFNWRSPPELDVRLEEERVRREVMALQSRRATAAQAERERQREAMREQIRGLCYEKGLDAWSRVALGSGRDRQGRRVDAMRVESRVRDSCLKARGL
jgi:hypothetical protein